MSELRVQHVEKRFGDTHAVKDMTFALTAPKIYGLLGRNGAGKSTLLKLITNRLFADSGEILLDGQSVEENDAALRQMYLMSEEKMFPPQRRLDDIMRWTQAFHDGFDLSRARALCQAFGLDPHRRVGQLSTGYGSIFHDILALCVDAPFIFLDEPVLGLDANHRDLFYQSLLAAYSDHPRTFVLSTHLIEEVAHVIEDVLILKEGALIVQEPVEALLQRAYTVSGPAHSVDAFAQGKQVLGAASLSGIKQLTVLGSVPAVHDPALRFGQPDLQKLFIHLTNA